jgi:hypothetical protein
MQNGIEDGISNGFKALRAELFLIVFLEVLTQGDIGGNLKFVLEIQSNGSNILWTLCEVLNVDLL